MYLPSAVGSCRGGWRLAIGVHAGLAVHRLAVVHPLRHRGLGADRAGVVDRDVDVLAFAGGHAVEERHGDAVQDERAAHVPRLVALSADRRDRGIRVARARHLAAEREMRGVVHLEIAPRPVLAEVGERGVDQRRLPATAP